MQIASLCVSSRNQGIISQPSLLSLSFLALFYGPVHITVLRLPRHTKRQKQTNKICGLSSLANYTDRETAAVNEISANFC
jgi:hypothetical protein